MIVRLLPDTARVCARSVSLNASSSSGVIREVSPTTSPGSSALASAGSPSVAARSPARNRPADRCTSDGSRTTDGAARSRTRSTAAIRSPPASAGTSRPVTRTRVDGSSPSHEAPDRAPAPRAPPVIRRPDSCRPSNPARAPPGPRREPMSTITSTGARVATAVPAALSTVRTSASMSTESGVARSPATRGRVSRGSEVISTSAVTVVYSRASSGTGPLRRSAPCSPADTAAAATQSKEAPRVTRGQTGRPSPGRPLHPPPRPRSVPAPPRGPCRPAIRRAPPTSRQTETMPPTRLGDACSVSAAVAQAARAGGTSLRSTGPSWRGLASPSRFPEAACTARRADEAGSARASMTWASSRFMAARDSGGRRSAVHRCRRPRAVRPPIGNRRAVRGGRRCAAPTPVPRRAVCRAGRRWPC